MTFKYKLSHRLALLRSALLLVVLPVLGCNEGDLGSLAPYDNIELAGDRVASISPKAVVIEADKPVKFKSSSESPESVKWTATGGKITPEGTFTSTSEGDFLVVSSVSLSGGERTDTARVRVVRSEDDRQLTISPRSAELVAGQPAHFTVATTLADGSPTDMKVNFKVSGGEIDRLGNFVAGAVPGTYMLIAFSPGSGLADTASITVRASTRQIVRLLLAPATAAVAVGGSVKYVASAQYQDGSTEPVAASFTAGGGTISPDGQYTAGNTGGEYKVTARTPDNQFEASAAVSIASEPVAAPVESPAVEQPVASTPVTEVDPGSYPNQPSGLASFMRVGFDPLAQRTTSCNSWLKGPLGCWWRHGPTQSVKTDVSGPAGAGVLELVFPAGLQPGYGTDQFGGWAEGTSPRQYRQVYESGWFKIPSADFETQLVGVKLWGYWGVGSATTSEGPVQVYMVMSGNEMNTSVMSSWNIWFAQQGADSRRLDQNLNLSKKITANTWHRYEVVMTLNDIGARNGTLKVWLDGVQVLSHSDVKWRDAAHPTGFYGRSWTPIWGGGGGTAKTRTDRLWVNQMYISGLPL